MQTNQIKNYILTHVKHILKPPAKNLAHPFIVPGQGYTTELWGWDAYWETCALKHIFENCNEEEQAATGLTRSTAEEHICGSVLNFLEAQEEDGFIPIMVSGGGLFDGFFHNEYLKGTPLNQHLPFLCRSALAASEFVGAYDWFNVEKLVAYMDYHETRQYDKKSGLFFWQDDIMIGIDNNPTVFYRPKKSGADVFLNCFIYLEYVALADIFDALGDGRAAAQREKAEALKASVNREMWDERDGIYYSQDVGVYKNLCVVKGVELHSGLAPHWNSFPLKIRFWGCFLPLYAGICSDERAERLCAHLTENDDFLTEYGVRSLAKNEKVYSLVKSAGNPSNWLGAVWVVGDYCIYEGLLRYGKTELAEKVRSATIRLLDNSLSKYGDLFESYNPDSGEPYMHPGFLSHNLPAIGMLK